MDKWNEMKWNVDGFAWNPLFLMNGTECIRNQYWFRTKGTRSFNDNNLKNWKTLKTRSEKQYLSPVSMDLYIFSKRIHLVIN